MRREPFIVHAPKFQLALAPTKRVQGTVRDKDSGRPIAGLEIQAAVFDEHSLIPAPGIEAITDAQGRYQLDGLSKAAAYRLFIKPANGLPYTNATMKVPAESPGLEPIIVRYSDETRGPGPGDCRRQGDAAVRSRAMPIITHSPTTQTSGNTPDFRKAMNNTLTSTSTAGTRSSRCQGEESSPSAIRRTNTGLPPGTKRSQATTPSTTRLTRFPICSIPAATRLSPRSSSTPRSNRCRSTSRPTPGSRWGSRWSVPTARRSATPR